MSHYFLALLALTLLLSPVSAVCDNLCNICSAGGDSCVECKRGYQIETGGYCQLSGTAGIIAGSILGGTLLFALTIVGLCVCINGWKRVFKYPMGNTQMTWGSNMETQHQIYHTAQDTIISHHLPLQSILVNGSNTQKPMLPLEGQKAQKAPRISEQNLCVVCMSSQVNVRVIPCGHSFHFGCLANWFNKRPSCPQCQVQTTEVKVQCNGCGNYNDSVSFCPPGCPNPNHKDCFLKLNENRLKCKRCDRFRRSSRLSTRKTHPTPNPTPNPTSLPPNLQYSNGGTITNLNNFPTLATLPSTSRQQPSK